MQKDACGAFTARTRLCMSAWTTGHRTKRRHRLEPRHEFPFCSSARPFWCCPRAVSLEGIRGALRRVSGAQGRNRTTDTCIFSAVLYRLSYLGFLLGLLLSTGLLVRRAVIESEPAAVQNGKCANRAAVMRERDSSLRRLVDLVAPLVFFLVFGPRYHIDPGE